VPGRGGAATRPLGRHLARRVRRSSRSSDWKLAGSSRGVTNVDVLTKRRASRSRRDRPRLVLGPCRGGDADELRGASLGSSKPERSSEETLSAVHARDLRPDALHGSVVLRPVFARAPHPERAECGAWVLASSNQPPSCARTVSASKRSVIDGLAGNRPEVETRGVSRNPPERLEMRIWRHFSLIPGLRAESTESATSASGMIVAAPQRTL
jgi:hypothetical protein